MSKKEGKKLSIPRSMLDIQRAYQEMCVKAGQLQYQIKVLGDELDKVNADLIKVNNEAAARQQLDKEEADRNAPASEEKKDV